MRDAIQPDGPTSGRAGARTATGEAQGPDFAPYRRLGDPVVSVIVTCHNYGHFLADCVESVLGQTRLAEEVIVIDDGSSDHTPRVAARYAGRVEFIRTENRGQAAAFNRGFAASTGDLILFLDADDMLKPEALETVLYHWHGGLAVMTFGLEKVDDAGRSLGLHEASLASRSGDNRPDLLATGSFAFPPTSGNVFARSALRAVMPMPEPRWRISADCYLIRAAALLGRAGHAPRVLGAYRVHGANNYARAVPGIQDRTLDYQNAEDIADALDALAETGGFPTESAEEGERLAAALRWRASEVRGRSRGTPLPATMEDWRTLLQPRWLPHLPFDAKIDFSVDGPHRAAVVREMNADGHGALSRPKALVFTVDPRRDALIVRARLCLRHDVDDAVAAEIFADDTLVWSGPATDAQDIAFPLPRDPWSLRRRVSLRAAGHDAVAFAAISISPVDEYGAAPRLPESRLARLRFDSWPGLSREDWKDADDHVVLAAAEGRLEFSADLARGGRLQLSLAETTAQGFLRIVCADRQVFAGDVDGSALLSIAVPSAPGQIVHGLTLSFVPAQEGPGQTLALDGVGLLPIAGAEGSEEVCEVNIGEVVDFRTAPHARGLLFMGWVEATTAGATTLRAEAMLRLIVAGSPPRCRLKLSVRPLLEPGSARRHVLGMSVNEAMISVVELEGPGDLWADLPELPPDGVIELGFHSVFAPQDETPQLEPDAAPFELVALQVVADPAEARDVRLPWATPPARPVFHKLLDDIASELGREEAAQDRAPDDGRLRALREHALELVAEVDVSALMMMAAALKGLATLAALGAELSGQPPSDPERAQVDRIAVRDREASAASLRRAIADILTRPAYRSDLFRDLAALPAPLYWRREALADYLTRPPSISTADDQARYADWLSDIYAGIDAALATEPPTGAIHELSRNVLERLRAARVIFGAGNMASLVRARSRAIERGLVAAGADLAYQPPPRDERVRLRVGVVARDVRANPEGWALLGMWAGVDRARIAPVLIVMDRTEDALETGPRFDETVVLSGLPVAEAVRRLRDLDLDVLIAGCYVFDWEKTTAILAHRLARVQIWHGAVCPTTGGFRSFDVALTHRATEPRDAQAHYTETVAWLDGPVQCAYDFSETSAAPAVDVRKELGLPEDAVMLVSGAMAHKITDELLAAWAEILARAPNAALVLYPFAPNWSMRFQEDAFRGRLLAQLDARGVPDDRVRVLPTQTAERVRQIIGAADLYLDSFPYTGATTVCEALAQGVPVLTCAGGALRQLTGASWVGAFGRKDLVTRTPRDYVAAAVRLACDDAARARERDAIRAALEAGRLPHCDPASFGPALTDALCSIAAAHGIVAPKRKGRERSETVPATRVNTRRAMAPIVRFAILGAPRTGSTLLCNLLNLTPGVLCHFELFHEDMIQYRRKTVNDAEEIARRNADPVGFLREVFAEADAAGRVAVGFKHFGHLSRAVTAAVIDDPGVRLIRLGRSNLLAQYSSEQISKATNKWVSLKGEASERVRTHFEPADFERWEAFIRRVADEWTEMLAKAGRDALFLDYTAILHADTPDRLSRLLGIRISDSRNFDIQRQNRGTILDRFSNPDEVMRYLAERKLSHWAERG